MYYNHQKEPSTKSVLPRFFFLGKIQNFFDFVKICLNAFLSVLIAMAWKNNAFFWVKNWPIFVDFPYKICMQNRTWNQKINDGCRPTRLNEKIMLPTSHDYFWKFFQSRFFFFSRGPLFFSPFSPFLLLHRVKALTAEPPLGGHAHVCYGDGGVREGGQAPSCGITHTLVAKTNLVFFF